MYIPSMFEENRISVLHDLMRSHPFATIVTAGQGGIIANHMPFFLDANNGEFGTLRGHVARANPLWREFSDSADSIIIFQGPQAYISPSWYPSKHEHGKAVPTWNYAAVHAHGIARVVEDGGWLLNHVTELSDLHEGGQSLPWKVSDAPKEFTDRMIEMIVGVEIPIAKIIGKWKVSQNRPAADKLGVAAGLESRHDDQSKAMSALVLQAMRDQISGNTD